MVFRKHDHSAGFSLIEVLVAITILGLVIVPISSSLVLSFRLNARSDDVLQAQLAVSSAVETIMAEGYSSSENYNNRFPDVVVTISPSGSAYSVHVAAKDEDGTASDTIYVETYIRPAPKTGGEGE